MTALSGKTPQGDGNGLSAIEADLVHNPKELHVVIALIDCMKITTNADSGEITPTVRIRRIEVVAEKEDRAVAEGLMRRALDQRTGREALPYDLEQELRGVFRDGEDTGLSVDKETGEVSDKDKDDDK